MVKLCNPVNKNNEDPGAPSHPGHLVCYAVRPPRFDPLTATVDNTNFGSAYLRVSGLREICLPAVKLF